MALVVVNSSDTISEVVDKINEISTRVGNLENTPESNMVDAINAYNQQIAKFDTIEEQIAIARKTYNIVQNGGNGSISYNNLTGVFTFQPQYDTQVRNLISEDNGLTFSDTVDGQLQIESEDIIVTYLGGGSIQSNVYTTEIRTTEIQNSAGEAILTIREPGS